MANRGGVKSGQPVVSLRVLTHGLICSASKQERFMNSFDHFSVGITLLSLVLCTKHQTHSQGSVTMQCQACSQTTRYLCIQPAGEIKDDFCFEGTIHNNLEMNKTTVSRTNNNPAQIFIRNTETNEVCWMQTKGGKK